MERLYNDASREEDAGFVKFFGRLAKKVSLWGKPEGVTSSSKAWQTKHFPPQASKR
ncbi:hypothetical protein [Coleofasciculus sp. E1-EBD-02]|uniref:hypothetical protein n=1 Tax=Coleofasciculus sp. E1-EBD-02 TaxID=3068481 RepID=UPI0032F323F0